MVSGLQKLKKKNNNNNNNNNNNINDLINKNFIISTICEGTAPAYFGAAAPSILNRNFISNILNQVNIIKCGVNNKITLEELNHEFIGELWAAKNYVLTSHNCQDFAAEVIKILKAVRIKEEDKIRMNEKFALPNCLIKALTSNEGLSTINIIGRIPIVGLAFDMFAANHFVKK